MRTTVPTTPVPLTKTPAQQRRGFVMTPPPLPTSLLASDGKHADPDALLDSLVDADARRASSGLTYLAEHAAVADLTELPPARPEAERVTRIVVEEEPLDTGIPAMFRRYGSTVRWAYDPEQTSFAGAQALIAVEHGIEALDVIERRRPTAYVPPTECDVAERVTCGDAKGSLLNAYLYTPEWEGKPDGPTALSVYAEPSHEDDLDYPKAVDFLAQLDDWRTKLAVMVDALAPQDTTPAVQPREADASELAGIAVRLAMQAVTASLAGLQTNPRDVSKRLHRAIDNAQGWHLAEVGDHAEAHAYASSRFSTAVDAMADALGAANNRTRMARALRNALDMVISEAGVTGGGPKAGAR